jgi:TPR repeat protein
MIRKQIFRHSAETPPMDILDTCRSAFAIFLSFALLSSTCMAQSGAQQFPEDQPGFPQYPAARPQSSAQGVDAAAGAASLDFPPDRNDSVALQCDQLADHPLDPHRVGDGVVFDKLQVEQALPPCEQAAERQPLRPRYQYLYGRILNAAKRYPDAAAQYAAADHAGYGFASFNLGQLYEYGTGLPKDLEAALRLYFRAGNAGVADAFAEGGDLYLDETPPDYAEAKSWLEHAVQGGSADGFDALGWLYESGNGVNKDLPRAFSLFNEAAQRGSPEGAYHLALTYYHGFGVQQDRAAACQWFIRAADQGDPSAEQEAGFCYYNGTGVAQNHETAFNWFALAGQAGLLDARVFVADMLERGDGHNQDSTYAVMWYQAAAEQGSPYAMTELGAHLRLGQGVAWSEAQAMQWFEKAAQKGYAPAETSLAMGYENGLGQDAGQGKQDYAQAAYWFGQAANHDDAYAQLNLGVMYEKGWGLPQNLERAKQLYARAAASSNPAIARLGQQYFSDVPDSAPPEGTPQRTALSSSKNSNDFWTAVVFGALAVGVVAALTSGGSTPATTDTGGVSTAPNFMTEPTRWQSKGLPGQNCVDYDGTEGGTPRFCQY